MAKKDSAFIEQFDAGQLHVVKDTFADAYGSALVCDWVEDPLQAAIDEICDVHALKIEPQRSDVEAWVDELDDAIQRARSFDHSLMEEEQVLAVFREKRSQGETFLKAARATGKEPAYVMELLGRSSYGLNSEQIQALRRAHQEEQQAKAHKARQKLYRMLGGKIEATLKEADFSRVPADKLFAMATRLAELTRRDELHNTQIRIGFKST